MTASAKTSATNSGDSSMTNDNRATLSVAIQFLQLVTLGVAVAGVFLSLGRKDERLNANTKEIEELRDIASSLVRTSIESTTTNREQDRRLDDLRNRLARLENRP